MAYNPKRSTWYNCIDDPDSETKITKETSRNSSLTTLVENYTPFYLICRHGKSSPSYSQGDKEGIITSFVFEATIRIGLTDMLNTGYRQTVQLMMTGPQTGRQFPTS